MMDEAAAAALMLVMVFVASAAEARVRIVGDAGLGSEFVNLDGDAGTLGDTGALGGCDLVVVDGSSASDSVSLPLTSSPEPVAPRSTSEGGSSSSSSSSS